jgi:enoyl-CoA hydratase/carnithine racemase
MTVTGERLESSSGVVLYRVDDGIAWITINRPESLNAINLAVHDGLKRALQAADEDESVNVVILSGAGRSFSAGGDLKAVAAKEPVGDPLSLALVIWELSKPVIAAVHGHVLGQGCELAAICDLTVAAEDARFGEVEVRHGWGPPIFITPFVMGLKAAKEFMLTGGMIDAQTALRLGLVNRVVPGGELTAAAEKLARDIASLPQSAVQHNKRLINQAYELRGFKNALELKTQPS